MTMHQPNLRCNPLTTVLLTPLSIPSHPSPSVSILHYPHLATLPKFTPLFSPHQNFLLSFLFPPSFSVFHSQPFLLFFHFPKLLPTNSLYLPQMYSSLLKNPLRTSPVSHVAVRGFLSSKRQDVKQRLCYLWLAIADLKIT